MPALENPKHERFAQLVFQGLNASEAYEQAVGARHPSSASRLRNTAKVKRRLAELSEQVAEKTVDLVAGKREWVIQKLIENHNAAYNCGQHSAAVGALKLLGVEDGMFVERSKNEHSFNNDPTDLTKEQLAAIAKANGSAATTH